MSLKFSGRKKYKFDIQIHKDGDDADARELFEEFKLDKNFKLFDCILKLSNKPKRVYIFENQLEEITNHLSNIIGLEQKVCILPINQTGRALYGILTISREIPKNIRNSIKQEVFAVMPNYD